MTADDDAQQIRAIEALKYRYVRNLDSKDWDSFADCMTPDVTSKYGGL